MLSHGLLPDSGAPSKEILQRWLDEQGIIRDEGLDIVDMEDGSGWRLDAGTNMKLGDLICSIPKTSILSHRTSSLPPLPFPVPSAAETTIHLSDEEKSIGVNPILHLTLCLLHEFGLNKKSKFYGYLQSLPRVIIGLPIFWNIFEIGGIDGEKGYKWLKGTECERELKLRENEGLGLSNLQKFYSNYASHLPPTSTHSERSPIVAFYYCFSLISTRAFMIDLYHLIGLCPFADILNHSIGNGNTSLSSDDFVCHLCGSLKTCQEHDIVNDNNGIAYRLLHLDQKDIERIESDEDDDTVELRLESPLRLLQDNNEKGIKEKEKVEIFNSYGDNLSDSKLLVEWGFILDEFTGDGLIWDLEDLNIGYPENKMDKIWEIINEVAENIEIDKMNKEDEEKHEEDGEDDLICGQNEKNQKLLNLDQSGRLSINILCLSVLFEYLEKNAISEIDTNSNKIRGLLVKEIREIQDIWLQIDSDSNQNTGKTPRTSNNKIKSPVIRRIRELLQTRLSKMHKHEFTQDQLFDLRDSLKPEDKYQYMAMTISINERVLIISAMNKWEEMARHVKNQ
ncbi:uncharacterized protein L201_004900 [Kwoniella dendrophila CBS 6074]|uniref:SET domain-containing protein n=1 Tax=Kwoniella dendrophila CBS 6074 TaxID=1295534 RepID=A0AAX4JX43_9TREE